MEQTTVEWLKEMLIDNKYLSKDAEHLFEEAEKMFEQQIKDTWVDGRFSFMNKEIINCEQYYQEIFKSE